MYYGYILSILIFIGAVLYGLYYWYKTEKSRESKRTIIPQYEPPQNIRPAMAEIIVKEKLTSRGLAATIVDLAVRGYVGIEEEAQEKLGKLSRYFRVIIPLSFFFIPLLIIVPLLFMLSDGEHRNIIFILFLFFLLLFLISVIILKSFPEKASSDYIIKKIKPFDGDPNLEEYEKEYLNALFGSKEYFSTKELKRNQVKARVLYRKVQKIKDKVYKKIEVSTNVFEIGPTKEKIKNFIWGALGFFLLFVFIELFGRLEQFVFLVFVAFAGVIGLYAFIKYEARLSDKGIKLKEDWLGFKMYLETAEKYRMRNLKPEFFEKYLPYAMIFGVEKKWAKAFEAMNVPSPSWYSGAIATGVASRSSASSFSPTLFSASFTSSFTSAFSSSGAGGASGGGGAGGGAGGGGGGAG